MTQVWLIPTQSATSQGRIAVLALSLGNLDSLLPARLVRRDLSRRLPELLLRVCMFIVCRCNNNRHESRRRLAFVSVELLRGVSAGRCGVSVSRVCMLVRVPDRQTAIPACPRRVSSLGLSDDLVAADSHSGHRASVRMYVVGGRTDRRTPGTRLPSCDCVCSSVRCPVSIDNSWALCGTTRMYVLLWWSKW